jgi:hypothetical protein
VTYSHGSRPLKKRDLLPREQDLEEEPPMGAGPGRRNSHGIRSLNGTWKGIYCHGGSLYRSTGQNINGPNINELQINCSIGQQKPVDV